jgi:peptidoglycan/xylan/chitin deacetylase (PgdA/CDA1 family)
MKTFARLVPHSFALTTLAGRAGLRVALYHHIGDGSHELLDGLNVATPIERFEEHLDALARDYDVVDLATVIEGTLPPRPLLITFDDAYRSVVTEAAPRMAKRRLPGVSFVTTGPIERGDLPLDNLLCLLIHRHGLSAIEYAINQSPGRCRSKRELTERVIHRMPYEQRVALAGQLAAKFHIDPRAIAADSGLFMRPGDLADTTLDIASHGYEHTFAGDALEHELVDSAARIASWTGKRPRAYSVPYGRRADATSALQSFACEHGIEAMFLAESTINARDQRFLFDRVAMTDAPPAGLFAELEVLPRIRRQRNRWRRDAR